MGVQYKSQLKAAKKYIQNKAKFSLWYPKTEKRNLEKFINSKNLKPREVFEIGLKKLGYKLPQ